MERLKCFIGPCVLESESLVRQIAESLLLDLEPLTDKIELLFKGSFDKANRSSINSKRGLGIEEGLKLLEKVKKDYNIPVVTDFHLPEQADSVASIVDYLQVPAFLCRQTDMIVSGALACKKYDRTLKVKKGQFLSPYETKNIVEKAQTILPLHQIILTERGTTFGYNNLVVDMASFQIMKSFGVKTVFDATHSVQMPGGLGDKTGGKRDQIPWLARAAVAAGADGIFLETHPIPDQAFSDAANCIDLKEIKQLITNLVRIYEVLK